MAEWPWRYSSRSKLIMHDTPHASDHLCLISKESIQWFTIISCGFHIIYVLPYNHIVGFFIIDGCFLTAITLLQSLETARFGLFRITSSFWNLTGTSAAGLPRCLSNFKAMEFKLPISRFRNSTRSYDNTSCRIHILKRGLTGPGSHI